MIQHEACAYMVVLVTRRGEAVMPTSLRFTRRECTKDWANAWKAGWPALRAAGYRVRPVNLRWNETP